MIFSIHSLLAIGLPLVLADVEFTSPTAGENVPVGAIDVKWKDSGRAPPIVDLTQYSLALIVGGNNVTDMLPITTFKSGGDFSNGNTVTGTIPAGIYGDIPNGFFFRITSTSSQGGQVINYSDRFTITGLTGSADSSYRNAVEALDGDTSGPPRSGNAIVASSSSSSVQPTSSTRSGQTVTVTDGAPSHSNAPSSSYDSGSNTGLIAGAVVGCIAFLIAVIGFGVWAYFRRRKRQDTSNEMEDKDAVSPTSSVELAKQPSVSHKPSIAQLSELSAEGRIVEIGDGIPPPELDSNNVRAELPGDYSYEWSPSPLTPISPSLYGEETLDPTLPRSGF